MELKILIGDPENPDFVYESDAILSLNQAASADLVGEELAVDSLTLTLQETYEHTHDPELFVPRGSGQLRCLGGSTLITADSSPLHISDLAGVPYGTKVSCRRGDVLTGKYYVDSISRTGREQYRLYAVSAMGLLDRMEHPGGLYNGTFGEILGDILSQEGRPVIEYSLLPEAAALRISGWLPHGTRRESLYQLLLAAGVNAIRGEDGNPLFTLLYPDGAKPIPDGQIFDTGSVTFHSPASQISVTEHAWTETGTEQERTVFDNSASGRAENLQIWFADAPIIPGSLRASGELTFRNAGVNGAVISGCGTLTGKPYTHSTQTISRVNPKADTDRCISVQNATLCSILTGSNLVNRLFAYYCGADGTGTQTIRTGIAAEDPLRCGSNYLLKNPFQEPVEAYLQSVNLSTTSIERADCEMLANFTPAGGQGLYEHYLILDKETFQRDGGIFDAGALCPGATELLAVLIGGGQGGESGWPGENGTDAAVYTHVAEDFDISAYAAGAEGGAGGAGGQGGRPGKVLYVTLRNPTGRYRYTIGQGGEGGGETGFIPDTLPELRAALEAENPGTEYTSQQIRDLAAEQAALTDWTGAPNEGAEGTETTFADYTSADGTRQPYVYHPILKETFAKAGASGISGGAGGAVRSTGIDAELSWVRQGQSVSYRGTVYEGGAVGNPMSICQGLPGAKFAAFGGNGAGAAVGLDAKQYPAMNGANAPDARWHIQEGADD